jgi:hypothetical protein
MNQADDQQTTSRDGQRFNSGSASSIGSGRSTGAPNGTAKARPTNERIQSFSRSTPTVPTEINWTRLSERGTAILRQVGIPLSKGLTLGEVARDLGISARSASALVDELRTELEQRHP